MGDTGEAFREAKNALRTVRDVRRRHTTPKIKALRGDGFEVKELTEYHYRINGVLDLFPTSNKWHDLTTGKRGRARDLVDFARHRLTRGQ